MTLRIQSGRPAILGHKFIDGESPADPTSVSVAVVDVCGDDVASGSGAVVGDDSGRVTFALAAQPLSWLTVTWTATIDSVEVVEVDEVNVVGGRVFDLAAARASDASLASTDAYPAAELEASRLEVEDELELICDRSPVPQYRRAVLDGSGGYDLLLTDAEWSTVGRSAGDIRAIRSVMVADDADGAFVALTAGQLAAVAATGDGMLRRVDGDTWPLGTANIIVEYEYGLSAPPSDLRRAAMLRLRSRLNLSRGGIPDRATSFTAADGGTYRISQPGAWATGIPEVDAAYGRHSRRSGVGGYGGRRIPASRSVRVGGQRGSLFHRGGY